MKKFIKKCFSYLSKFMAIFYPTYRLIRCIYIFSVFTLFLILVEIILNFLNTAINVILLKI